MNTVKSLLLSATLGNSQVLTYPQDSFFCIFLEPLVEYRLLKSQGGDDERVNGSTNRDD
jgi:hypothetical protein